jgi:hypothetical protein
MHLLKVNRRFGVVLILLNSLFFRGLIFYPDDRGVVFLQKLVDFHGTARSFIPEDRTIHNRRFEDLRT